ncbi:MAG: hypothetical protein ABSB87_18665, partial [Terriglobales bacterium]
EMRNSMSAFGMPGAVWKPAHRASSAKAAVPIRAKKFLRSMRFLGRSGSRSKRYAKLGHTIP